MNKICDYRKYNTFIYEYSIDIFKKFFRKN